MLPDFTLKPTIELPFRRLNAPTGAWCSLTRAPANGCQPGASQCTYRCVVLPDEILATGFVVFTASQCTYRCVVLPDSDTTDTDKAVKKVSMHLQVRGAP